jgi:hypothetical protein
MPAWAFKRARGGLPNANPVQVNIQSGRAMLTSHQPREPLLCDDCENRFGKVEDLISRVAFQEDGRAPFLDLVGNVTDASESGDVRVAMPGELPLRELLYFGVSLVWRAAVAKTIAVGCYMSPDSKEAFRRYLLGATDFPDSAACTLMFHDLVPDVGPRLDSIFTLPVTTGGDGHENHRVVIFGLQYLIASGRDVPAEAKRTCIHHRAEAVVFLVAQRQLLGWPLEAMTDVKPAGKLAESLAALARGK